MLVADGEPVHVRRLQPGADDVRLWPVQPGRRKRAERAKASV
jgi:hypothetical protein